MECGLLAISVLRAGAVGIAASGLGLLAARAAWGATGWPRAAFLFAMLFPVFLPTYITTTVWIHLLGKGGIVAQCLPRALSDRFSILSWYGPLWVSALCYWPYAGLLAYGAQLAVPRNQIEAAALMGGRRAAVRKVLLRRAMPAAVAGGLLAFAVCLADFDIPALLLQRAYTSEIFYNLEASYDPSEAARMALPLMAVLLAAVGTALAAMRGRTRHIFRALPSPHRGVSSLRASRPTVIAGVVLLLLSTGAPVATLVAQMWPLRNLALAFDASRSQWWNSVLLAALTSVAAVALGLAVLSALVFRRRRWRMRAVGLVGGVALLAFILPGPVLGLWLTRALSSTQALSFLYDGIGILIIAHLIRFFLFFWLPVGMAFCELADSGGFEAARLAPGGGLRPLRRIILPSMMAPLAVGALLCCCLSLGELSATIIVAPPGRDTVSMKIFDLLHFGHGGIVAALCAFGALLVAVFTFAATRMMRRHEIAGH